MADDKQGRDDQADDEKRRQRERELAEARERAGEAEPMQDDPDEQLGDLDDALEAHEYPTSTDELVESHGDHELETQGGYESLDDVLAPTGDRIYGSAEEVRTRIRELINR